MSEDSNIGLTVLMHSKQIILVKRVSLELAKVSVELRVHPEHIPPYYEVSMLLS